MENHFSGLRFNLDLLQMQVKDIQKQYYKLLDECDFETLILVHGRWSAVIYDYKNKYLDGFE